MEFKNAVRYLRNELGLTQTELADALRVASSTIGRWEKGKSIPNRSIAAALLDYARSQSVSCIDMLERSVADASEDRLHTANDMPYPAEHSLFCELIDDAPFPVYACDTETDELLYANSKAEELTGYNLDKLVGKKCYKFLMRRDTPCDFCHKDELSKERLKSFETLQLFDGAAYRVQGRLIKWDGHDAQARCFVPSDVTAREKAEDKLRISEEMLRIAAETDKRTLIIYDVKANVCRVESRKLYSAKFGEILENIPASLVDTGIVSRESENELCELFTRIRAGEQSIRVSLLLRTGSDEYQWFECNAATISDADGKPDHAVLVLHDITEQRVKEAVFKKWQNSIKTRPAESYTLFRCNLSRNTQLDERDGSLLKIEFDDSLLSFNDRTKAYTEQFVYPEDKAAYSALLNSDTLLAMFYRGEHMSTLEYRETGKNGEPLWRLLTVEMVEYLNSTDVQVFLMYEDIDDRKKAEQKELELLQTDPLTGVLNRSAFVEKTESIINGESTVQHALLMMDLDGLRYVNDTFGHAAGDQALADIAAVLRSIARDEDLICRLGGDEFLILLREIPYDAAIEKTAKQICEQVKRAFSRDIEISVSIGISVCPRDGRDFDELFRCADKALFRVKKSGKNNYAFFSTVAGSTLQGVQAEKGVDARVTASKVTAKRRMLIVDDDATSRALLTNIFSGEYTVDLVKGGAEALVRLRHYGASLSVVLLDLIMSPPDGYEVLQEMQANVDMRAIPVVVVSSDDDRSAFLKAIEYGAADFVTKPVDAELVRLRVKSAINKAENERLRAQNSYLQLQRNEVVKYHTVLESTGTVVIEYDWCNHVFVYADDIDKYIAGNYNHRSLWQVFLSDMIAKSEDVKALQEGMILLAGDRGQKSFTKLVMLKTPTGAKHWFRANIYKQSDSFGLAEKMIITFNDVHEEVISDEKLLFMATRDELTGLYNRAGFIQKASELIDRHEAGYYVMSCIDIEKFKVINDQYGTEKGDAVLRLFADGLKRLHHDETGICCRITADNFAVLYPSHMLKDPEFDSAHRSLSRLDDSLPLVKFSVGRCFVTDKSMAISAIYDRATIARDTVKGRYDAYIATYDESMRTSMIRQQEITGQMKQALERGEFEVWLQPQFNHATGMLSGAEALVRWKHPVEGIISPAEFIPIFERNGFVYEVDKFVWEQTCALLRKWLDKGLRPVPVSVNISRYDVFKEDLIDVITGLVKKYKLPMELLHLEITESAFSESAEQIIKVVQRLVDLGFVVEIDDFGSGYSSLNTLKDVPAQVLKMDMRFLENDSNAQRGGSIIESVVRMARWLGMAVIAEGVETVEQADFLKSIGCDHLQGYLYSKPRLISDYEQLFLEGKIESKLSQLRTMETWNNNAFWNPSSMETLIFNSYIGGACIFEYHGEKAELLRYNDDFADIFSSMSARSVVSARANLLSVLDEKSAAIFKISIGTALKTKDEVTFESVCKKADGSAIHVRAAIRQIAEAGDRSLFYCVVSDITAQRDAERGEREAASRIAAILDNVDCGITAVCAKDGIPEMIFSNDRFYTQLGYTKEQFADEVDMYFNVIHPDDRERVWSEVRETLANRASCSMEYSCVKRDGSTINMRSNIAVCTIDGIDGDVMITVETDISELVEVQKKKAATSERLKAIMDNATSGISAVVLHADGTAEYLLVNDKFYDLVGYTREQYAQEEHTGLELMHPDDLKEYERQIIGLDTVGQTMSFEFRAKRRDGRWVWIRDDLAVIALDGVDAPVQLSCFTDITLRKRSEDRLRFVNELARKMLSETDIDSSINYTLKRLMAYYRADRCYIVELCASDGLSSNTYEVCADGVSSQKDRLQNVRFSEDDPWYTALMQRNFYTVDDVDKVDDADLHNLLLSQDIHSIMLAPLWRDGHLIGFAGVDNPKFIPDDADDFTAPADYLVVLLARRDMDKRVEHANADLIDNIKIGVALYEYDGKSISVIHINKSYWKLVGREPADYSSGSVVDVIHHEDRAVMLQELDSCIRQNRDFACNFRVANGEGGYTPFYVTGAVKPEKNGKYLLYVTYTVIDKKTMSVQEMLPIVLSAMMASSEDLSFVKSADGRYIACSKAAATALGLCDERDIIGKTSADVFSAKLVAQFTREDNIILKTGKPLLGRLLKLPTRDGKTAVYSISKYPLLDGSNKVIGIYSVCRDITAQKSTELELHTLLRVIPSGILKYSADESAKFAYINRNFIESLGYSEEGFRKKFNNSFREMVWKEDRVRVDAEIKAQEGDGGIGRFDYRIEDAEGQLRWFHDEGVMVTDESGKTWYYVTLVDITAQRKGEANLRLAEEEYRLATRHSGHAIGRYSVKDRTLTITEDAATRLALPECIPDVPYGRVKLGRISEDTAQGYVNFYEDIMKGKKEGTVTFKKLLSGGWRWVTEHFTTIFDDEGKPVSAIVSYKDVTDEQEKEIAYKKWHQSIEGRDLHTYTLFRCNLSKSSTFDMWEGSLVSVRFDDSMKTFNDKAAAFAAQCVYEGDRARYMAFVDSDTMLEQYYRGHRSDSLEYREPTKDGGVRWLKLTTDLVEAPNSSDVEVYLLYEDIDKQKRAELETMHMAETDPLTGLLNRKAFSLRANELLRKSGAEAQHAFFMLDIDGFKTLNDTFGHTTGDEALVETSQKLQSLLRRDDLLGRLGGDEFVMLLCNIGSDTDAMKKAEQVCRHLMKPYSDSVCLTASIGVSMFPRDGRDAHTLYEKADSALYAAKAKGKNTYGLYKE